MAIGLHAVVGQRKLQPQVVGEMFDEVVAEVHDVQKYEKKDAKLY